MAVTATTSQMRKRMGNKHDKSSSIVLIVFLWNYLNYNQGSGGFLI